MKTLAILLAVILTLPCCTTSTTTHPDGSVTKTSSLDASALIAGATVAQKVIPIFYGPRQPASGKTVVEVQEEPKTSWISAGMSLLGL